MFLPRQLHCLLLLVAATLGLAGCGGSESRPTGKVVLDGAPVARANIRFEPTCEGCQGSFVGLTDEEGTYRLDYGARTGIPPGAAKVTVSRALLPDGSPLPPGEEGRHLLETGRAIRETYVYDVELPGGSQRIDFDLIEGDRGRE